MDHLQSSGVQRGSLAPIPVKALEAPPFPAHPTQINGNIFMFSDKFKLVILEHIV